METSVEQHVPTISVELSSVYLGDKRLCRRLQGVAEAIAQTPSASLPTIFKGGAALEGTYRLLRNARVTLPRVLAPHHEATWERAQEAGSILALHDTTEFAFDGEAAREGLGPVSGGQGFFAHVALAVTADGRRRPLGVLGLLPVIRTAKPKPKPKRPAAKSGSKATTKVAKKPSWRVKYADPNKESLRWLNLVEQVEAQSEGRAEIVHVMDREADDYALLATLSSPRRFVIRRKHNRLIAPETPGEPARKVDDALAEAPYLLERTVKLSARRTDTAAPKAQRLNPTRAMRTATLRVSSARVTLVRPHGLPTTLPATLALNVVDVREVGAPEGEMPVSWVLLTSEPVTTKEQVERVVDIYRARWVIEDYFMALKTGCAFESRQLESATTLLNLLAILVPIAWRLLLLRNLARDEPDAPGSDVLPPRQLEVLNAASTKKLPVNATAREVFLAVAALGGHIKHNGNPGWRVLARGYQHLLTLEQGWLIARASLLASSPVNPRSAKR
jgi:hypothetical protein